ncbi:ABC-type bacteriocin/lantibiotic exporter with double-glycine peptidase domain [Lactobacillus colini]|uniref:ABC-type bacteriocin/lantibiotic exporter with double-glycine peptidase domain n=1 Tax=Lactobacillus colini TaxID=1819254 RepID=A0ABS4MD41_9LACO|nr:ABC transporter ATP-binding protein [Lactobacillus colini]MBP2057566.1 ABC-type bacteriocin/lantibiotic exporter with double-glycine peptidase domain [Lactobacillus colini]
MSFRGLFKTNPVLFVLASLGFFLAGATAIGGSWLLMYDITAMQQRQWHTWVILIIWEAVILGGSYYFSQVGAYFWNKVTQQYNHRVRDSIIKHYYDDGAKHSVAQMQNRLITDIKNVDVQYFQPFSNILYGASLIFFSIVVTASINLTLLVVTLIAVGLSIYLPKLLDKMLTKSFSNISDTTKIYLKTIGQWADGINELRRYLAGEKFLSVMANASKQVEDAKVNQIKTNQTVIFLNKVVGVVLNLALSVYTAILIKNNLAVFGAIVTIGNLQFYISQGIQSIGGSWGMMKATKEIRDQLFDTSKIIKKKTKLHGQIAAGFAGKDLSVAFPNGETLTFPDFAVRPGEKVLLTGDSGAGKSTLFKVLLGEIKPASGRVEYFDEDGEQIEPDLAKIGYIAQTPRLFPDTIENNITMFSSELSGAVNGILDEVEFSADIKKFPNGIQEKIDLDKLNISGGQRQKIVLARAKIHDSEIILIDEGTSAIDQNATMKILRNLLKSEATIFFIAHNLSQEMIDLFDHRINLSKS